MECLIDNELCNELTLNTSTASPHHNNNDNCIIKYSVNKLYKLRETSKAYRVNTDVSKRISELGISKRVRRRRAGRHMHKKIPVHTTRTIPGRPENSTSQDDLRKLNRTLIQIPKSNLSPTPNVSSRSVDYDFDMARDFIQSLSMVSFMALLYVKHRVIIIA